MWKTFENTGRRLNVTRELLYFIWVQKLWWLMPMMISLLLLGLFFWFAQSSAIAPFIYTLF